MTSFTNLGIALWYLPQLMETQTLRAFPQAAWKVNNTFHRYHSASYWLLANERSHGTSRCERCHGIWEL